MITALAAVLVLNPASIADFTLPNIDGKPTSFREFRGKALLIVNVASRCGLTPQYEGLQKLYTTYRQQGLIVLGFPANNFGNQEPGTNQEIKQFCSTQYSVTFPMFAKVSVNGTDRAPIYQWLIDRSGDPKDIEWNFGKFLVHRDGVTVERFSPRVRPEDPALKSAIEKALAKR